MALLPHLFSQYDFKFRAALYAPEGDHYRTPDIDQELRVLSDVVASLEAIFTPYSEEGPTYVESVLLSLPPEAADEELDWRAWEACLLQFDPAFMPKITIETRSSAPCVLTRPEGCEKISRRRLLVQLGGPRRKGPGRRRRSVTPAEEPGLNIFTPNDFPERQIQDQGNWSTYFRQLVDVQGNFTHLDLVEIPSDVVLVPQRVYSRYYGPIEPFGSLSTIHFNRVGGKTFGLWLSQVLTNNQDCDFINGDEKLPFSQGKRPITIGINWPGYCPWEIVTRGVDKQPSFTATRGKLARIVAQAVQSMIKDECSGRLPGPAGAWSLKQMNTKDILLTELRQVSEDSWQPILCCRPSCVKPSEPSVLENKE